MKLDNGQYFIQMSAASEMDNGSDMDEPMASQSKVIKKKFVKDFVFKSF